MEYACNGDMGNLISEKKLELLKNKGINSNDQLEIEEKEGIKNNISIKEIEIDNDNLEEYIKIKYNHK